MRRKRLRTQCIRQFQIALLLTVVATQSHAQASRLDLVTWLHTDFPSAASLIDGKPGHGINDRLLRHIVSRWPEATHRYTMVNTARLWRLLEEGQPVCTVSTLRTPERESKAYFVNTHQVPAPRLVVRSEVAAWLPRNRRNEVRLESVLKTGWLRVGITNGRSYGAALDDVLARHKGARNLTTLSTSNLADRTLRMVALGRADVTIEYPVVMAEIAGRHPEVKPLQTWPVAESSMPSIAAVACSRTAWGKAAAEKIQLLLSSQDGPRILRETQRTWQASESEVLGIKRTRPIESPAQRH